MAETSTIIVKVKKQRKKYHLISGPTKHMLVLPPRMFSPCTLPLDNAEASLGLGLNGISFEKPGPASSQLAPALGPFTRAQLPDWEAR